VVEHIDRATRFAREFSVPGVGLRPSADCPERWLPPNTYCAGSAEPRSRRPWPGPGTPHTQAIQGSSVRVSGAPGDPLDRIQVGPVPIAGLHGVPLAGPVLEAPSPLGDLGAVPGVPSPVLGMDQPEALLSREVEGLGVVGQLSYGSRLGRASNGAPRLVEVPTEGLTMTLAYAKENMGYAVGYLAASPYPLPDRLYQAVAQSMTQALHDAEEQGYLPEALLERMKSLMERMSAEPAVRTKGRSWPRCQK
jgi:hypothetical protein